MEIEEWKYVDFIEGFENDRYMVSNLGRIKSMYRRHGNGAGGKVSVIYKEVILKGTPNKNHGYVQVTLNHKLYLLHVLVARAFIPNVDGKPEVNHKDGDKTNNKVKNLEWVTKSENAIHRSRVLNRKGGLHFQGVLKQYKNGVLIGTYSSWVEPAKLLGVDPSSIRSAVNLKHLCRGFEFITEK